MAHTQIVSSLLASLVATGDAHASISMPAMRNGDGIYNCPWCQGSADACSPSPGHDCHPPSPCWTHPIGGTVTPQQYGGFSDLTAPDGTPWVDPNGGAGQAPPLWCPGKTYPIRFYINADHNGVYRWESQRATPGQEAESAFQNFTDWYSINNDPNTNYYLKDGATALPAGQCTSGDPWAPDMGHCRDDVFAETQVTLPTEIDSGETVMRWLWYGCMLTDETRLNGCERSLFVNCLDVVIGTEEQCGAPSPAPVPIPSPVPSPTPTPPCPGGSLDACIDACPPDTFTECVRTCQRECEGVDLVA